MTATELYNFLYDWMHGVLPSTEIRQSHQDYPSPEAVPFLALSYSGNWTMKGPAPSKYIHGSSLTEPKVYTWRGQLVIYEIGGDGELLQQLVESLDNESIRYSFSENAVSVLRTSGPTMSPMLEGSKWKRESTLTLELLWARAYQGSDAVIEEVVIEQQDENGQTLNQISVATEET